MTASYLIPSDLSEKQIEADVSGYFGYMSPLFGRRLRVLDINEQLTGADKVHFRHGVAYFFQFKKPIGLKSAEVLKIPHVKRKNESALMEIRRYRDAHDLDQSPYSVCFPLHGSADTPVNDLQHNVLRRFEKPPTVRAMYICPTCLDSSTYEGSLREGPWRRWRGDPFSHWTRQEVVGSYAASQLFSAPFLRGHATVIPHVSVTSPSHYYSFSRHATDIAFHSPEILDRGPARLSDYLAAEIARISREKEAVKEVSALWRTIFELSQDLLGSDARRLSTPDDPFDALLQHGRLLSRIHGIRQVLVLANTELLDQDRARGMSI